MTAKTALMHSIAR